MGMCAVQGEPPEAPDYDDDDMWAACYPHKPGGSEWRPKYYQKADSTKGAPIIDEIVEYTTDPSQAKVDLFYVHPCTYHIGMNNNAAPGDSPSEEIKYCLQTQASAFAGLCRVYAPYYRQAASGMYEADMGDQGNAALGHAYRWAAQCCS